MDKKLRFFVPNSWNPRAVWGFCLQGRRMLGEKTENNLLCVLSLKHRLLKPLEFQKGHFSFRKYYCMTTALIQRWHCAAVLPWNRKKKRRNGNQKNISFLYTFPHSSFFSQRVQSWRLQSWRLQSPNLLYAILNLFHVALKEPAQGKALNKHPLHSSMFLLAFQASCHFPSVTQLLLALNASS